MQIKSKVLAKTGGDKHKILEKPRKTILFADPAFHKKASDRLPKKGRDKIGQHFPLQTTTNSNIYSLGGSQTVIMVDSPAQPSNVTERERESKRQRERERKKKNKRERERRASKQWSKRLSRGTARLLQNGSSCVNALPCLAGPLGSCVMLSKDVMIGNRKGSVSVTNAYAGHCSLKVGFAPSRTAQELSPCSTDSSESSQLLGGT